METQLRRRAGMPKKKTAARAAPPADGQNSFSGLLRALLAAVVATVRVDVCAVAPLMVTDAGILHVAGSVAPVGPTTLQDRLTAPVNPPAGVTVMVEVLPVAAPGFTVMLPLLATVKLAATAPAPVPAKLTV